MHRINQAKGQRFPSNENRRKRISHWNFQGASYDARSNKRRSTFETLSSPGGIGYEHCCKLTYRFAWNWEIVLFSGEENLEQRDVSRSGKVGNRCRGSWKAREMRKPVFYDRASGFFDNARRREMPSLRVFHSFAFHPNLPRVRPVIFESLFSSR